MGKNLPTPRLALLAGVILVALAGAARAAPAGPNAGQGGSAASIFERIWGVRTLYDDPDNPVLQRFDVRGRLQVDYALFESNRGDYSEAQVRRFRIGFESHWLADLKLHVETDLDLSCEKAEDCDDDVYEGLTDAYLAWAPSKAFELKVGKLSAPFTLDGTTSSTRLITLERNNLTNNLWFPVEYHAGIGVSGEIDAWRYRAGVYSSSTTEEFGSFNGGTFGLLSLSHDFSKQLGAAEGLLTLDYVYNQSDPDNVSTRDLSHVASLHFRYDTGRWGARADLSGGVGYRGQPDLVGLALVPFVHLTKTLQIVGRYTLVHSFGDNGVRFSRYENRIESGRGDQYDELFLGLNWFLYGHRLKLQSGFKYTWMGDRADDGGDYRGWGWTTGLRMSW